MARRRPPQQLSAVTAFAPGRANLIGEHTDYNDGLSLPFAIAQGVRVRAERRDDGVVVARALDHGEEARLRVDGGVGPGGFVDGGAGSLDAAGGWAAFVRGTLAELAAAGVRVRGARLEISGDVPEGAGLSSSAALAVALALALGALAGEAGRAALEDRTALARLCSRVENDWVGARTGLLDQLASLYGAAGHALRIDFRALEIRPVPLRLGEWRLVSVPSGETRSLAATAGGGYAARRRECEQARDALGLDSLRDARYEDSERLPDPLGRRVRHVLDENARVEATVAALETGDLAAVGPLLDASHASLRDLFEASTDAVECTVARVRAAGAAGARLMGGGFGGEVLALFAPGVPAPAGARALVPSGGARIE